MPAEQIVEELNSTICSADVVVVTAEPGAGKSTLLPLTMRECCQHIIMLEPRRLAARSVAVRMAEMLGEDVGKTVGYRVRLESRISKDTRIEVVTEGVLSRMLIDDPTLDGIDAVIFDEFHERSLNTDLSLALLRETKSILRPELKLIFMSATIETELLEKELGAKVITCPGRMYPVTVENLVHDPSADELVTTVVKLVKDSLAKYPGDILVFLPGQHEIELVNKNLVEKSGGEVTRVYPLYGSLPFEEQKRAIARCKDGERKVVLATNIAETSLTIEGVRVVIDSGLCRQLVFDHRNEMSHLETVRISLDMAKQRSGRAGRTAEGHCIRLYSKATEQKMLRMRKPEIESADVAPVLLSVAAFTGRSDSQLKWLTEPDKGKSFAAQNLLVALNAIDEDTKTITPKGREMSALPCHPRIARMLLEGEDKALAADVAAILEEKDPMQDAQTCDLSLRISDLRKCLRNGKKGRFTRIADISAQYRSLIKESDKRNRYDDPDAEDVGALLSLAYPERIAHRYDNIGTYRLSSGENARMDLSDPMCACEWIVVADLNSGKGSTGRIFLAAPIRKEDVRKVAGERRILTWNDNEGRVVAEQQYRIGNLIIDSRPLEDASKEEIKECICRAATRNGLSMFDWNDKVHQLQTRIEQVRAWHPELDIRDVSTESLLKSTEEWLEPYLEDNGHIRKTTNELKKLDLCEIIWSTLSWEQQTKIDSLAPEYITVPTGSRIRLDYRLGAEAPVLSVRLQECFGLTDTPCVNGGGTKVLMELLSPGYKPVQLTSDLKNFWTETYFEVRKELRRRYPKHFWPENPLEASAVRGVKKSK